VRTSVCPFTPSLGRHRPAGVRPLGRSHGSCMVVDGGGRRR
jgi:ParB-like chromosome segregation protein Spo0J